MAAHAQSVIGTVEGTALFVDIRGLSKPIMDREPPQTCSRTFSPDACAFSPFPPRRNAGPGDAVLAILTGPIRIRDSIDVAKRVIAFVRDEFNLCQRESLTCHGKCGWTENVHGA